MNDSLAKLEPVAKALAATGVAQSFSFCMERKYLNGICSGELNGVFTLKNIPNTLKEEASWIEVQQIGKPLEKSSESCFTAIQKILYSCFLPKKSQLLFLITGDGVESKLFLGVRSLSEEVNAKSMVKSLNEFMKGTWPGLQTKLVSEKDGQLSRFKTDVEEEKFSYYYAFTGIPSMESQYKSVYPATVDKLMAGMSKSKKYAYLVVADPIENEDVEGMLYECREMNGQAESLKSMSITQGLSKSLTDSISHTIGTSHSTTDGTSTTERKLNTAGKFALGGAAALGISAAASFFPAAGAVVESTMATIATGALGALGLSSLTPLFIKQKQVSHSETTGTNESDTNSQSKSVSNTESISRNVVNKHIEAVSEKLFYHTQRLESGKAIGLWKVGVYLMADKKSDILGGSMQLRSILSGQESIYEPIRIHDITSVMDKEDNGKPVKDSTLAKINSPNLMIKCQNGKLFDHPLGDHYKSLKTVLTTKELSYLVNFPLRSVPGISVVDSSPEFSLNQPSVNTEEYTVELGHLLYGGSETGISYRLPINTLAKHTLLSGINGTGKTNTVKTILNSISSGKGKIPFLVIEPAKTEYVDWAIEYNKQHKDSPIKIFIPGCKTYRDKKSQSEYKTSELQLNPFEPVWLSERQDPYILTHIDRLKSTFAAAFPMYDILPVLLEDLIYILYQSPSTNWIGKNADPMFGKTLPPTLTSMAAHVEQAIEAHGYEKRVSDNMKACLNTRIASLRRGWKKNMLDTLHSTPLEELFEQPCVINLSYVGDDADKAFFMSLILQFLYEYRTAQAECGKIDFNSNSCKHLTVIEEAHRVMRKCENSEMPQYKTAMMFSNMLSEIRAYGEGMFLVDQVPTRLIPDAIKNTNTKITHRLVSEDDSTAIAESMGITKEQRPIISKLLVGQCLVSTSLTEDKHWIKINKVC